MGIAVLASGSGTILAALIEAALPIDVVAVDRRCRAVDVALDAEIPVAMVERKDFNKSFDRTAYTANLLAALEPHDVVLVAMAGFGTVLGPAAHDTYPGRILNTHPSLLPAFKGWHAVEESLAAGVKVTGCTVHLATSEVDVGPILAQEALPVLEGDTAASLHERIKQVERRLYPETIWKMIGSEALAR